MIWKRWKQGKDDRGGQARVGWLGLEDGKGMHGRRERGKGKDGRGRRTPGNLEAVPVPVPVPCLWQCADYLLGKLSQFASVAAWNVSMTSGWLKLEACSFKLELVAWSLEALQFTAVPPETTWAQSTSRSQSHY